MWMKFFIESFDDKVKNERLVFANNYYKGIDNIELRELIEKKVVNNEIGSEHFKYYIDEINKLEEKEMKKLTNYLNKVKNIILDGYALKTPKGEVNNLDDSIKKCLEHVSYKVSLEEDIKSIEENVLTVSDLIKSFPNKFISEEPIESVVMSMVFVLIEIIAIRKLFAIAKDYRKRVYYNG